MTGMPKTREALAFQRSVVRSGEPYTSQVDSSYRAALAEVSAVERVVEAARECRDAMRAERADVLMENGAVFIEMLAEALDELDEQTEPGGDSTPVAHGGETRGGHPEGEAPSPGSACPCSTHGDPDGPKFAGVPVVIDPSLPPGTVKLTGLTAVPVSKVLRELPCDNCGREIERGEYVLRERDTYGFRTTCDLCAEWMTADELFGRSGDSA